MSHGPTVFISHSTDTRPLAEELNHALESQGIETWVDFKNLRPGQRLAVELDRALAHAQWLLVLVGSASRSTASQEAEWSAMLARTWRDQEKRLLPVIFGQTESPPFLRNWVSLRIDPVKEPSTWTRHVLDALQSVDHVSADDASNRRERQHRLDEISKAAEELRKGEPDEPPIATDRRPE